MSEPSIGLALGGGSARGLAHIPVLEVFDELGIKPKVIAGCSIGALLGAGYAGGLTAKEIRERAELLLSGRIGALKFAFGQKRVNPFELLALRGLASLHVHGEKLASLVLPETLPEMIEDLAIRFKVIATDFDAMEERVIERGSLVRALGASIAIPGVILGPQYDGHSYVDGGVTNPVPFDHVRDGVDIVVAVDVTGRPREASRRNRTNMDLAVGSILILFNQVASLRRQISPPDIYVRPAIDSFSAGDYFRIGEVLEQARPAKDQLKRELEKRLRAAST
ncbi:patatin-like phospholipase family protein [Aestuariivirga sp.]|uniref:patatin-like phospholipase family protein n=1 Tax=Aestuariivirga sp. TaxID=2650926 RepID=UPI0025C5FF94|nr:patatin-like phospholipase family protein [Aestuariivirga sp.]MCA3555429.1 patatin-like phospholipase family protein [Aestuariivirga sp.]